MNFDIKNIKNLQIFNFIKIEQVLGAFLGTQSWGCLTRALDQFGYKLETLSMLSDKVGPTYQR